MPTSQSTVDFIVDQCTAAGEMTARKMFGEYALYCEGKMVGSICDAQLFVVITPPGRARLDETHDAPPYEGAKPRIRVPAEKWEDAEWMSSLIRETAAALPAPTQKKTRSRSGNSPT